VKGFKDTTKTIKGHCFATGGIVPRMSRAPKTTMPMARPVLPRPHVMPGGKPFGMGKMAKLARGGSFGKSDGAGGPYNSSGGNSLEMNNRPYSKIEQEHPRNNARPGYAKGGIHIKPSHKGLFTKKMTGSESGKLTGADVQKGLHSSSPATRKQANFARMARRGFKKLAKAQGGLVAHPDAAQDKPMMEGIAKKAIAKHVESKPPQGHGVKAGNLAFNRTPLCGGGRY
jgi:hypothetical protein